MAKRALKTFATKKDAEAWTVSALHEVQLGTHTRASASKTVEETWKLWLEQCEADKLEVSTIRQRRIHLKHHVGPFVGTAKLSDLSTPFIYDFDTKLRQAGRSNRHAPQGHHQPQNNAHVRPGTRLVAQNVARGVRIKTDDREAATRSRSGRRRFPVIARTQSPDR